MQFKDSLLVGEQKEYLILDFIKKKYPSAYKVEGYCKECDIYVPECNMKIEVKFDKKSNHTGNIVVEIEMFNKPSALFTTKSDYWIFYDGFELMIIRPIDILVPKQLIRNKSKICKL